MVFSSLLQMCLWEARLSAVVEETLIDALL